MRVLRFVVDGNYILKDPACDFDNLFPLKDKEIIAEFSFSPDWNNFNKVAAFWSILDSEYTPQIIQNNSCTIPKEALHRSAFKIQVIGQKRNVKNSTNKLTILQVGDRRDTINE